MFDVRSSKLKSDSLLESNLEPRTSNVSELSSVGRRGALVYEFEREGARTVLTRSSCTSPWHYFPPTYLDDSGCACMWLVNPSGGLVGGDHVTVEAQLHAGTHVLMTSPSANRVYRSLSEPAVQEIHLSVGPEARLEWLPEVTIPFAGSRFRQSIHVDLAPGATVLLWDAVASGRVARGERWAFTHLENEIRIVTAMGRSVLERYVMAPTVHGVGQAAAWNYVGSLYLIGEGVDAERGKYIESRLAEIVEARPDAVLGGVSEPATPGLAVKLVAKSAPDLHETLGELWQAVRSALWSLSRPDLRRY